MPYAVALPENRHVDRRFPFNTAFRLLLIVLLTVGGSLAGGAAATAAPQAAGAVPQAAAAIPQAAAAGPRLTDFDNRMLVLVNNGRRNAGVPEVQSATGLTNLSLWWSGQLADGATNNVLQHNPNAFEQVLTYGASNRTAWAENVAKWSPASTTADAVFNAYWNSPGHKANILGAGYRYIGIASVTGGYASYNTMTFTDKVDPGQVYVPPVPVGTADSVSIANGTIRARGWAFDPGASGVAVPVLVYVNSVLYSGKADLARADVNAAYGISGSHGFDVSVPAVIGANSICIYAASVTVGGYKALYCSTLTVAPPSPPVGHVDLVMLSNGTVAVGGWAYDPAIPATSIPVQININGAWAAAPTAAYARGDVNSAFSIPGNHGFAAFLPPSTGANQVCVWAMSTTGGPNQALGCWTVINTALPPTGRLDSISRSGSTVRVTGWAYDPQAPGSSIPLHIYVNGSGSAFSTDTYRGDVNGFYDVSGLHGFDISFSTPSSATICEYAISITGGGNTPLDCRKA